MIQCVRLMIDSTRSNRLSVSPCVSPWVREWGLGNIEVDRMINLKRPLKTLANNKIEEVRGHHWGLSWHIHQADQVNFGVLGPCLAPCTVMEIIQFEHPTALCTILAVLWVLPWMKYRFILNVWFVQHEWIVRLEYFCSNWTFNTECCVMFKLNDIFVQI